MSKKEIFKKIYTHIYEKQDYYLNKININTISNSVSNLKTEITTTLNISPNEWKDSQLELKSFIHSLVLFNYLLNNKPDIFNRVLECSSQETMITLFNDASIKSQLNDANLNPSCFSVRAIKSIFRVANLHKTNITQDDLDDNKTPNVESISIDKPSSNNISNIKNLNACELAKIIESDKTIFEKLLDMTDEQIVITIKEKFADDYIISDDAIDEYLSYRSKSSSINISESKLINKIAILEESSTEKIRILTTENNELITKISTLNNENSTLASQLNDANKELEKYKAKMLSKSPEHIVSVEIKELNRLLNSNSSESGVTIKNEILVRASKYADKHALIQSEYIISENRDLKSEIVQLILLSFLHEKSLF